MVFIKRAKFRFVVFDIVHYAHDSGFVSRGICDFDVAGQNKKRAGLLCDFHDGNNLVSFGFSFRNVAAFHNGHRFFGNRFEKQRQVEKEEMVGNGTRPEKA